MSCGAASELLVFPVFRHKRTARLDGVGQLHDNLSGRVGIASHRNTTYGRRIPRQKRARFISLRPVSFLLPIFATGIQQECNIGVGAMICGQSRANPTTCQCEHESNVQLDLCLRSQSHPPWRFSGPICIDSSPRADREPDARIYYVCRGREKRCVCVCIRACTHRSFRSPKATNQTSFVIEPAREPTPECISCMRLDSRTISA
jgi:hypothetical protein